MTTFQSVMFTIGCFQCLRWLVAFAILALERRRPPPTMASQSPWPDLAQAYQDNRDPDEPWPDLASELQKRHDEAEGRLRAFQDGGPGLPSEPPNEDAGP